MRLQHALQLLPFLRALRGATPHGVPLYFGSNRIASKRRFCEGRSCLLNTPHWRALEAEAAANRSRSSGGGRGGEAPSAYCESTSPSYAQGGAYGFDRPCTRVQPFRAHAHTSARAHMPTHLPTHMPTPEPEHILASLPIRIFPSDASRVFFPNAVVQCAFSGAMRSLGAMHTQAVPLAPSSQTIVLSMSRRPFGATTGRPKSSSSRMRRWVHQSSPAIPSQSTLTVPAHNYNSLTQYPHRVLSHSALTRSALTARSTALIPMFVVTPAGRIVHAAPWDSARHLRLLL